MGRIIDIGAEAEEMYLKAAPGVYKPDFQIMTAGLWPDQQDSKLVHTIGSSTEQDLQGDYMSIEALNTMTLMPPNLSVWLNHSYDLPGDIFGSIRETPKIIHADGVADLHLGIDVELDNPDAARVKKYIDNGRRLGCSIGCLVTKYEVPDDAGDSEWFLQPIIIHGVRVLEFSIVGIPANQRAWVTNAVRGLFTRTLDPRLAPAMKSLWPRQYEEILQKAAIQDSLLEKLKATPTRPGSDAKLLWHTPTHKFMIVRGKSEQEIETADIKALTQMGTQTRMEYADRLVKQNSGVVSPVVDEVTPDEVKTACGSTSWPLNMDKSWDKGTAHGHLLEWAGGKDDFDAAKFKKVHFRYTGEGSKITDFHFPFCDVTDGKVEAIWHAVTAAAAALGGARGGASDEGDEDAMRSKIAAYYRKADKTPPWEGDEKRIEEMTDVAGYAVNKDGSVGVAIKADGNHEPTTGYHRHHHEAYGHGDVEGQHSHEHHHDNHNIHHHDHSFMGGGEYADEPYDPDNDGDIHARRSLAVPHAVELTEQQIALLASINALGKLLALPEITPVHVQQASLPVQKGLDGDAMEHAKSIHDHLFKMTNGAVCSNEMSMEDAQNDAAMAEGRDVSGNALRSLSDQIGLLSKALESLGVAELQRDATAVRQKISSAQKEIASLQDELQLTYEMVSQLKSMPLGNPIAHRRTVQEVSREEMAQVADSQRSQASIESVLAQTEIRSVKMNNGQMVSYRHWPAGVGKGVRPLLTSSQVTFMHDYDITAYREGGAANVPLIDDPAGA